MARSPISAALSEANRATDSASGLPNRGRRGAMLKILHTADWHVGRSFRMFKAEDAEKLARDRLSVIDRILGLADQYEVDAILCAGDLFDSSDPDEAWWRGLATIFSGRKKWTRPILLLPGNHDPLTSDSVYNNSHPFRRA